MAQDLHFWTKHCLNLTIWTEILLTRFSAILISSRLFPGFNIEPEYIFEGVNSMVLTLIYYFYKTV